MMRRAALQLMIAGGWLGLSNVTPVPAGVTDKDRLLQLFDTANIDVTDPSEDGTADAISIKVDGDTVIGIDGSLAVFKFKKGKLAQVVLWSSNMHNSKEDQ